MLLTFEAGKLAAKGAKAGTKIGSYIKDLTQFADFMKLRGKKIPGKGDAIHTINNVKYTFTEPKGVKANAEWMSEQLRRNPNLSFEIFNVNGQRKIITKANQSELQGQMLSNWLGLT